MCELSTHLPLLPLAKPSASCWLLGLDPCAAQPKGHVPAKLY